MGKEVSVGNSVSVGVGGVTGATRVLVEDGIGEAGATVLVPLGNEFLAHALINKMLVNKIEISRFIFIL